MPLREFEDSRGVRWTVWDVTPEKMHKVTSVEDYLGDYQEGWLSFEAEGERRRLPRVPRNWDQLPDGELEWLLDAAQVIGQRAPRSEPARQAPPPPSTSVQPQRPDEGRLTPAGPHEAIGGRRRIFTDPDGRVVIACVERLAAPVPPQGGKVSSSPGAVLRFKTDHRLVYELSQWPDDWERLPKERLVALFLRAKREAERETAQREDERAARPPQEQLGLPRRRSSDQLE